MMASVRVQGGCYSGSSRRDVTVQTGLVCLSIGKEDACRLGGVCPSNNLHEFSSLVN